MKVGDVFSIYLDASRRARQNDARLLLIRQREDREALLRDLALLTKLIAAGRLSENAATPAQIAAQSQRDRDRNSRIQATLASAGRRIAALKARKASGKPSGPLDTEKAQKEAKRVRRLDQQADDIRATANSKASGIRSQIGK